MLTICIVILALSSPGGPAQTPAGFSGKWVAEDTRMGAGGDAVESAIDAHLLPRMARTPGRLELVVHEEPDNVDLERPDGPANRMSLPLSGAAVAVKSSTGLVVTARALRDGAKLRIQREHSIQLGASEVLVQVEEHLELLPDGTLRVETISKSGDLVQTQRTVYRRVQ